MNSRYLLAAICAVQFFIILMLLTRGSNLNVCLDELRSAKGTIDELIVLGKNCDRPEAEMELEALMTLQEEDAPSSFSPPLSMTVLSSSSITNSHFKYEGVAMTLLLDSPKWFQRRYSVMVANILTNLPATWAVQIFYSGSGQSKSGIDINPGLSRMIEQGRVILTTIPQEVLSRKKKKILLMTDKWIWNNVVAEKVLVFGGNSAICANSKLTILDFLEWDWVGSPWYNLKKRGQDYGPGGEGGISLRTRQAMIDVIDFELSNIPEGKKAEKELTFGQEDHFFVSRLIMMNDRQFFMNGRTTDYKIAPPEVTKLFSAAGNYANETVFAASMTLPGVTFETRDTFLSYCPELKVIFPSLHDPACFGAKPEPDKCALSICALRGTALNPNVPRRKGGC